tara:strand:- start:434 stop:838 length:405 start_codon:yes stop_codon:yes gene_type:complete
MNKLLKWEKTGLKTPLARARGLGAAKSGVHHWMMQRMTAISNLVLGLWLLYSLVTNADLQYVAGAESWLANPVNAIGMILFVISSFYHAVLGCQVIIEDYVHNEGFKIFKLVGQRLIFLAMAIACIFSILQVAL